MDIRFRTDGSLFNLRRLLARTKTIEELITELLFADDCALLAHTEEARQHSVNRFSDAAENLDPTISLKKTEVWYQPPPREAYNPPHTSIDGTNLNAVEHFTYLDSVISNDATVGKDLDNRLSKASSSFERLPKRVWQSHSLHLSTKFQVYRAVVVPALLYGAETWVPYRKQIRLLERFHQRCFRSIHGIKWQDHVSNKEVLKRASLPSIESICFRCSCAGLATSQGWKTYACPKQSSSTDSKKESAIVVPQESVTKISRRDSLHRRKFAISHGSMRPQTETAGAHQ